MKRLYLSACLFVLCLTVSGKASAADTTYTANDIVGSGSVTGTITTDGTIGTLSTADILGFNLTLNDGTGVATLTDPGNAVAFILGNDVTATATQLIFDFTSDDSYLAFYSSASCSPPEWFFNSQLTVEAPCNGTPNDSEGVAALLPEFSGTYSSESGNVVFATVAVAATPEPPSVVLLGLSLAGLGAVAFWRQKQTEATEESPF